MSTLEWAVVIAGAGFGTYALRATPFVWQRLYKLGQDNFRFLSYASFAITAGIVARAVFYTGAELARPDDIAIKIGAVVAGLTLYKLTSNILLALFAAAGLAVLVKWLALSA